MLENPYSPPMVNAENAASVFRGEGNVELEADGEQSDVTIKISPIEVSAQEQKYKLAYLWAGITKIDVTRYGIVFSRDQAGAIQIPLRLFRSSIEAEQCVALAKRYWTAARSS